MRLDYRQEKFTKVKVCGIACDYNGMRIDRGMVSEKRYHSIRFNFRTRIDFLTAFAASSMTYISSGSQSEKTA